MMRITENKEESKKGNKRGRFILLCVGAFVVSFAGSVLFKVTYTPAGLRRFAVNWNNAVGTVYGDIPYGEGAANKFDIYVPADTSRDAYGLVVYLHAGGFTSGDKADDVEMLRWLCAKGYVAVGINYTLRSEQHPEASVYSQSVEIRQAMPVVVEKARQLGYPVDRMAVSGGSAGGCLALLYAYRDAKASPVPVAFVFEAVGPSSFYPEDWTNYGFDQDTEEAREAAAGLFGVMAGKEIKAEWFGTDKYEEEMKDVSALLWVDEETVPTVMAYGKYDTVQPYPASVRLHERLTEKGVEHEYFVLEHSGHGLQNDTKEYIRYMDAVEEYLDRYLPVK